MRSYRDYGDGTADETTSNGSKSQPQKREKTSPKKRSSSPQRQSYPSRRPASSDYSQRKASPAYGVDNRRNDNSQYHNKEEMRKAQYLRRKKRQRRNRIVGLFLLVATMILVTVILSLTVFFKIGKIEVKNNVLYTVQQVERMIDFKINDNMFTIGKKKQEESISSKLPYVKSAKITYKLPGTVVITVTETTAKYSYQSGETFYLLDEDLIVLEGNVAQVPEDVMSIEEIAIKSLDIGKRATFDTEKIDKQMEIIANALKKTDLDKITAIKPINETTNFVVYDGRIDVKLGSLTNIDYKLNLAKTAIDKENEKIPDAKGTLDVTVDKQARFTAI